MTSLNILVLGAGELGFPMLKSLAQFKSPGTKLTVLLRPSTITSPSASKAAEISQLTALGISLLPGDISSSTVTELAGIFAPYDTIITCTGFSAGPGVQFKICKAVLQAGVSRYFPWQFGVNYDVIGRGSGQDLFDEQLDVRDMLRSQTTTEWVIVSTGMFISFLFDKIFGIVDVETETGDTIVRGLGGWENRVTVTAPEDIGKLTADIVFAEPRVKNEVVFVAGQTISYKELATLVDEVLQKEVKREEWSLLLMKEWLQKNPSDHIQKYRVVFGEGRGVSWRMDSTWNSRRGINVEDVKDWMIRNILTNSRTKEL